MRVRQPCLIRWDAPALVLYISSRAGRRRVLVLTRKSNQSIMIGDEIEVSVLAIMGEKVRIGIEAPRSVPVFRKEVYVEIQRDQRTKERDEDGVDEQLGRLGARD